MPGPNKLRNTGCPVTFALDTFGDRWSLVIIRDMLMKGCRTYGEFLESSERIATNVLADRLQALEASGIITKSQDPENRRRVLYRLTPKGIDLAPVLLEMALWSGKHDPNTAAQKDFLDRIENDRDGLVEAFRARAMERDQTG